SLRFPSEEPLSALALSEGSDLEGRLRAILEPRLRRRPPSRLAARGSALLAVTVTVGLAILQPWAPARKADASAQIVAEEQPAPAATAIPATSARAAKNEKRVREKERGVVLASRRDPRSGADWYERGMKLHRGRHYAEAIEAFGRA